MEGKRVAADKPAEREDKRVERPEEPRVEEPKAAERRAAKPEVPAILGSGTILTGATRTTVPGRVSRDSLAMTDSNSFSNRQ